MLERAEILPVSVKIDIDTLGKNIRKTVMDRYYNIE